MKKWKREQAYSAINALELRGANRLVADYWLSLWSNDVPPSLGAFNPHRVSGLIPGLAVFEVRPGSSVRCSLAGNFYKLRFGIDISGKDWLALTLSDQRKARLERNTQIVDGSVSAGRRIDPDRPADSQSYADVQLPFANVTADGARTYMHHCDWRPKADEHLLDRPRIGKPALAEKFDAIALY